MAQKSTKTPKTRQQRPTWLRHFVYRKESWRTTWKLRLGVLLLAIATVVLTRPLWALHLGRSLVCAEQQAPTSDALLLENFDPDYLVFERTENLRRAGVASRVFVPMSAPDGSSPSRVEEETAKAMARIAHLQTFEPIPIKLKEPISLNAAYQIRDFLAVRNIQSVTVVAPGFRSRRSALIYRTVLEPAGISVGCVPVFGTRTTPENWSETTHGIQGVAEQFLKLHYYNFYALW